MISKAALVLAALPINATLNYISSSALEKKCYKLEIKGLYYKLKYDFTGNEKYYAEMNKVLEQSSKASREAITKRR